MCCLYLPDKHILLGADEGIYSLNITDQAHDIEMEQVGDIVP